ncbi:MULTISPECIES: ribosome maturation factor RimM [Halanaerobium]|uniref:Ribosome maturation factor RimM n=1 Tax=Halanaerobium kushneri TaxID=56779 RepID=A0A1N6Q1A4_9FIRM|nr:MULTISPECIES: ribosome maturation factor RimM [Halanaerobium]RCW61127.1 16S rRNA processing protein RimM [Halanaerobium sp. ST460_2HS_T2]SIQ10249.1 16S rRNA processing protein RimM [Halanaerobium kushneri]
MSDNYLVIGIITRFQGNKGEVRVKATTDIPERFFDLDTVYLKRGDELKELEIEYIRFHKQFVIIKFFDINSINEAEELKNYQVLIDESEKYLLPEDNFYVDDLIDCEVYLASGSYLGKLIDVIDTSGTDIFLVKGKDKEYMLPASREMILEIDLENKKIIVDPIPGILDL